MPRRRTQTQELDSKGRLTLGQAFANRTFLVQKRGDEIVLRLVHVVPKREVWLTENREALASVRRGLKQARAYKFVN